ncbi:MAG: MATE family efflux transporter [Anaeromicrobium sp.]|jgi:putative MATE family efflux protein|uniref:MATE family efflux transporter n=1 Tax=Anaeromicrobium sp. TaxID=1929132 RepID=UPI0025EF6A8C|nr:MATE family efflux transporter [Anaeromicrobium sp.]MCT4593833.1 MATE family efflux transporter [Anaeromicrobium sp.]
MNERIRIMNEERISTVLLKFGIPAIVGMLINAIYNFVDAIFVGGLGTSAMGAAAIAFPISMVIIGVGLTLGSGAASYIARLLGKGDRKQANKTASTAFFGSIILGVMIIIPSLIFIEPLLKSFGATKSILPFAKDYGYIFIGGSVFSVMNITLTNIVRAEGAAKMGMKVLIVGAILNMILDPIFIYTLDFGIKGAAIATVISQVVTTILLINFFYSDKSSIKLSVKYFTLSKEILLEIFKIGTPTLIFQILSSASMGLINLAAAPYGDAAVAAMGIVNRIFAIGSYVIFGYSKGFQPIAGYSYGAKKYGRLKESIDISLKWTTYFCLALAITQSIFARQIVSAFSNDPRVLQISARALRAYSIMFPFFGFQIIYMTLFLALGKAREGAILSLGRQGMFLIPTVLILPRIIGLDGVIFSQGIADFFTTLLTLFFSIKINNRIKSMLKSSPIGNKIYEKRKS